MIRIGPPQHGQAGISAFAPRCCSCRRHLGRGRRHVQQLAAAHEHRRPVAVREQPGVADAVEPVREHVQQEAAHELAGGQPHHLRLRAAVRPVVLPAEAHLAVVVECYQPAVGNRDPVGVAGEIGQHLLRLSNRFLTVKGFTVSDS